MTNGQYKPMLGYGPVDPCVAELGEHHEEIQMEISLYGNMSMNHVCPFEEVKRLTVKSHQSLI